MKFVAVCQKKYCFYNSENLTETVKQPIRTQRVMVWRSFKLANQHLFENVRGWILD